MRSRSSSVIGKMENHLDAIFNTKCIVQKFITIECQVVMWQRTSSELYPSLAPFLQQWVQGTALWKHHNEFKNGKFQTGHSCSPPSSYSHHFLTSTFRCSSLWLPIIVVHHQLPTSHWHLENVFIRKSFMKTMNKNLTLQTPFKVDRPRRK